MLTPHSKSRGRTASVVSLQMLPLRSVVLRHWQSKRGKENADTALRLARYFGASENLWLGLQVDYDIEETRKRLADRLVTEVVPRTAG